MKNKSLLLILILVAALAGGYYWLSSGKGLLTSKKFDLASVNALPNSTHGFLAIDFTSGGFERYISNSGYQQYVAEYNKLLTGNLMAGMDAYFGFLEKLGLWPKVGAPFKPSLINLVWFFTNDASGLQIGMFGDLASEKKNGALVSEISNFLKSKNFVVSDISFSSAKGISFDIFSDEGVSDPNQAIGIYRQLLGKRTFYMAEGREQLLFTTSKDVLEELLKDPATKGKAKILESTTFTKAMQQLSSTPQDLGFGYFDAKSLIAELKKGTMPDEIKTQLEAVPVTFLAVGYGGSQAISGKFLVGIEPQNENQKKFYNAMQNLAPYSPFETLPENAAMGFSVSGSFLKAVKSILDKEDLSEVPPPLKEKLNLLSSIDEITIGGQAASVEGSWPEGYIAIKSSVTGELAKAVKELVALAFAASGGNVPWKSAEYEGLTSQYILTPFNIGLYIAEAGDKFYFATSPDAMKALAKVKSSGKNATDRLHKESRDLLTKGGGVWALINYEAFAELTLGLQRSMAAFMPQEQAESMKVMETMKYMGTIGIGLSYSDGVIEALTFQELPKGSK